MTELHRPQSDPASQEHRRRPQRLVAGALLTAGILAAGAPLATSAAVGAARPAGATVASARPDVAGVTLHIGDQAGTGAEALLQAAGLLHKLPFKVTWSDFTSGPPMLQAMGAGSLDLGGVGDAPPVFAAAGGAKIAIVSAFRNDPNSAALVVAKNSPIHSISQLRGKRIAVAQGSSADYHLLTVLTKAKLTVKDVKIEYLQPAAGLAALTSGSADAWDVWSPYIEQAVGQDGARVLVNGNGFGSDYAYEVASRAALANPAKRAAIADFLTLLDQAHVWADVHLQAWGDVWAQATGLPASIMTKAAADAASTPAPITPAIVASEQSLVNAFYAAGLIPRTYRFSSYSYSGFNSLLVKAK